MLPNKQILITIAIFSFPRRYPDLTYGGPYLRRVRSILSIPKWAAQTQAAPAPRSHPRSVVVQSMWCRGMDQGRPGVHWTEGHNVEHPLSTTAVNIFIHQGWPRKSSSARTASYRSRDLGTFGCTCGVTIRPESQNSKISQIHGK